MDYRIRRRSAELHGTGYVEVGPGKYSSEHWEDGNLFVKEGTFSMAEGIVARHFRDYDHLSYNNIPKDVGRQITAEWRDVAARLDDMSTEQALFTLNLNAAYQRGLDAEVASYRTDIVDMLRELADRCDEFYDREDWVCILGV